MFPKKHQNSWENKTNCFLGTIYLLYIPDTYLHVATNKIKPVLVKKVNQKHSVDVIIQ